MRQIIFIDDGSGWITAIEMVKIPFDGDYVTITSVFQFKPWD